MSEFYIEKEKETSRTLFEKRLNYEIDSTNDDYKNLIDFNFGEKFLYGRVTRNFQPFYLPSSSTRLKDMDSSNPQTSSPRAMNFVADMFHRMRTQFDKSIADGKLSPDDPFLSSLKIYKAYEDPNKLYNSYLETYFNSLSKELKKSRFRNIEQFMTAVEGLLSESLKLYPITFSGFVKSRFCPISVSGLAIEIADAKYFNDEKKIQQFINSPNWLFYLNACRSYGFMVDKQYPWRLVADIASSECLQYSRNYNVSTTEQIMLFSYTRTDLTFFENLKFYLINLYNNNSDTYAEHYDCNGIPKTRYITRSNIDVNSFDSVISEQRLLNLYMMMRMAEEDKFLTEAEKLRLVSDISGIYRIKGISIALSKFEKIINQPFDSSGSLSYLYDGYLRRQEEP